MVGSLRTTKLGALCEAEGMTIVEIMQLSITDGVAPAICMNETCDYIARMEPDQDGGYCEECGTNSVQSALVLMDMV